MGVRILLLPAATLLAACSAGPRPGPVQPAPLARTDGDPAQNRSIVAFYNGEPLPWRAVAEKMLELDLKTAVDQYVRWRLVEDRRKALGITHTPEELRQRAEAYARQTRQQMGDEAFRAQFVREGTTQEAWIAHLAGSRFLSDTLTLDKILRYAALLEDTLETDRMIFVEESDAKKFVENARANGYDTAAGEFEKGGRKPTQGRIPREVFPKGAPPVNPVLDDWILEQLLKMKPGEFTGVEHSRSSLHYVVLLRNLRKGRNVPYDVVRGELMDGILAVPPGEADYRPWFDRELAKCRIEYGERKAPSGKGP